MENERYQYSIAVRGNQAMKTYYFYDPQTGEFTGQSVSTNRTDDIAFVEQNVPDNLKYIQYDGDIKNYQVDLATNEIIPKTNVEMTLGEIKQQIYKVREQYVISGDPALKTQLDSLQEMLNSQSF